MPSEYTYLIAFAKGFCLTQAVEIPLVWLFLGRVFRKAGKPVSAVRIIAAAFFANMATLPYLWFVLPQVFEFTNAVVIGEVAVLATEAFFYYILLGAPVQSAFKTSLLANSGSIIAGLVILPPFGR